MYPKKVIYFDTETEAESKDDVDIHRFRLGFSLFCQYDDKGNMITIEKKRWYSNIEFLSYIEKLSCEFKGLHLIAHNVYFDLQALGFFKYFREKGWRVSFIYEQGLTFILKCYQGKNELLVISSTNFYKTSIENLGKLLGLEKLSIAFDQSSEKELMMYCQRDTEILRISMENFYSFLRDNDYGGFALTTASQAFKTFRSKFMSTDIYVHNNKDVDSLELSGYFGGRCECFRIGKLPQSEYVTVDVNSMYPYVMRNHKYPTKLLAYYQTNDLDHLKECLTKYSVMARVWLHTNQNIYPVRYNKKLVFPVGTFETTLCTGSLKKAIKKGHIIHIKEYAVYKQADIFSEYVNALYKKRQDLQLDDNPIWVRLVKDLLNSLYGKFGQRIALQEIEDDFSETDYLRQDILNLVTRRVCTNYVLLNTRIRETGLTKGGLSSYAIAAHVTDYARCLIQHYIDIAGPDQVYYCDTDSMKIPKTALKNLKGYLSEHKLGALKIESETCNLELKGCKSYVEDTKFALKGVPKKAEQISDNVYQYMSFLGQKTHLRKGIETGFVVKKITKQITYNYDKGLVQQNGKVKPLYFFLLPSLNDPLSFFSFSFERS